MPSILYLHGDMSTGEKTLILEDLSSSCVQSGYFFGPGSPLNWGKDLPAQLATNRPAGVNAMQQIARETSRKAASMHATYWMDRSLLEHKWLRSEWLTGRGEDSPSEHRLICG